MNVGCYYCVLTTSGTLTTVPSQPSLIPGPDSRQVVFLSLLTFWVVFWEQWLGYSGDVLGLFAEEHDSEENEKRRKKKKGTKKEKNQSGYNLHFFNVIIIIIILITKIKWLIFKCLHKS